MEPIYEIKVTQRKPGGLTFTFYMDSGAKANALVNEFVADETFKVTNNRNNTRMLHYDVAEAARFIRENLKG